jgi:hypothetical protein
MNYDQAQQACACRPCPSFVSCDEKIAYCMPEGGRSKCITVESGCLCPGCPVQVEMNFQHDYYCTKGAEKEQK